MIAVPFMKEKTAYPLFAKHKKIQFQLIKATNFTLSN